MSLGSSKQTLRYTSETNTWWGGANSVESTRVPPFFFSKASNFRYTREKYIPNNRMNGVLAVTQCDTKRSKKKPALEGKNLSRTSGFAAGVEGYLLPSRTLTQTHTHTQTRMPARTYCSRWTALAFPLVQ